MAEFDRSNPLFERNSVPFEIITTPSTQTGNASQNASTSTNKRHGNFTVRILQGHRPARSGGERERVIRFEMSDECNLIDEPSELGSGNVNVGVPVQSTPGRRTPNVPIIHAPFMTADRGRGLSMMQPPLHQTGYASNGFGSQPKESMPIPNHPIELYELEVGESDFSDLRRDQALLVDFDNFANSLISLLQLCELGEGDSSRPQEHNATHQNIHGVNQYGQQQNNDTPGSWNSQATHPMGHHQWSNSNAAWNTPLPSQQQQSLNQQQQGLQYHTSRISSPYGKMSSAVPVSTYACRLETNASSSSDEGVQQWRSNQKFSPMHARFSIVESNQFRELTHLALNLNVGTDKTVRLYLSLRLSQTMLQNRNSQSQFAEQQRRSDAAETELIGLNKRLQELSQTYQNEKCQLQYQAEERLQTECSTRLAEVNEAKASKEEAIKALQERHEKDRAVLENKIQCLEGINAKVNQEKTAGENEIGRLTTKISFLETTNQTTLNELSSIRSQLQNVSQEKAATEKNNHQLQLQLSSLELSKHNQERAISQTETQRISAEKISADAKQTISKQKSQIDQLSKTLREAELEVERYKDLTGRYQTNRLEMKKNIKGKVEMIREQEAVLGAKQKEASELKQRVRCLEEDLQQMQMVAKELKEAQSKLEQEKKKQENQQQVISWLNKQVNSASSRSGADFPGGRINKSAATAKVYPTPAASISRVMPISTPYQRSYVTPEVKPEQQPHVKQLHPEPTPFSVMPRRPD